MTTDHIDYVILGAGISGLGAGYELRRSNHSVVLFEARASAGGLLDNFTVDGFRFDQAVHLSFATEPEVRAIFDQVPYITHAPEALCWDAGNWLRHPTQNNMHSLPSEEKIALIAGLTEAPQGDLNNYEDWLVQQYGRPIAQRWPMPYTEKYWTVPASELGTDWIGQRVRRADIREVLQGAFTTEKPNHFYAKEMRYPKQGGYRAFIEPLMVDADIRYNKRAVAIDPGAQIVTFEDESQVHYGTLISTLPIPAVIKMLPSPPESISDKAGSLFATAVDLISVGFNRPAVPPALWFYIYDRDIWAARAYAPSLKSPNNVPEGCSSLQFEIYSSPRHPQQHTAEEMIENTLIGIEKMGLATREDVAVLDHRRLDYGNVVYDVGMEKRRDEVLAYIRDLGILSAGRFGEWGYLWSNQSLMSGFAAGRAASRR